MKTFTQFSEACDKTKKKKVEESETVEEATYMGMMVSAEYDSDRGGLIITSAKPKFSLSVDIPSNIGAKLQSKKYKAQMSMKEEVEDIEEEMAQYRVETPDGVKTVRARTEKEAISKAMPRHLRSFHKVDAAKGKWKATKVG